MASDDIKKRFVQEIKVRGYNDRYIDAGEEQEILKIAVSQGVSFDSARGALAQVCESEGYVLESKVLAEVKDLLDTFAGNDGMVSEKEFNDTVAQLKKRCNNKRTDLQCKKLVVQLIEGEGLKVKTGFFGSWYAKVKKEVGSA